MLSVKKQIITDEAMQPVAVLIDYQDWQKIEKLLENSEELGKEEFNIAKYAGAIQLRKDPLEYQKEIRGEW
ncbi:hypothetical protein PJF56_01190 [Roseofilum sp. BLCC_M91]|uniref:Prevent-host-death protein n=1 Tax=Roseofilum halophilum BLCC-M91 TaxID=3022259 RepID=A0ABT7BE58_9CYAN|nr:hypothetical protein [Roseofilum halophilum]MDJ1177468.1 hypothetical protein [Roseofilum halophilum BLCC-M91]